MGIFKEIPEWLDEVDVVIAGGMDVYLVLEIMKFAHC